jgi:hypothetical protein
MKKNRSVDFINYIKYIIKIDNRLYKKRIKKKKNNI